jgi:glycosyltransferase involved in cell wall biosynthesis
MRELRYLAEDAWSGYGEASYRLVRALRGAGVNVEYRAWHGTHSDTRGYADAYRRDERPGRTVRADAPTIAHLVPEHYPAVQRRYDGTVIGHTVWETDRIPSRWAGLVNAVEGVIVPCEWNRDVFAACGVTTPIEVVPHVACEPVAGDDGKGLTLTDDVIVFYTIARWEPRKAPWLAVRAFLSAFTADDPVALVVKTSHLIYANPLGEWGANTPAFGTTALEIARLIREYPRPPHVRLEATEMSQEQIAGLHARGDCYVSLAKGEGWGIGAFDACAYGNPVVTTGFGGQLDYLDPDAAWLVDYDEASVVHHWPLSYSPDQNWAEPSVEHAAKLLQDIAADIDGARARAAPLRERVLRDYAPTVVAARFLAALDEMDLG